MKILAQIDHAGEIYWLLVSAFGCLQVIEFSVDTIYVRSMDYMEKCEPEVLFDLTSKL